MNLTQQLKEAYWEDIEQQLTDIFYIIIYQPILQVLSKYNDQIPSTLLNATFSPLMDALRSGRVQYQDGTFSGQFSSSISRVLQGLGAKFSQRLRTYYLSPDRVPPWVMAEAGKYRVTAREAHEALQKTLGFIQDTLDQTTIRHQVHASKPLKDMEKGFAPIAKYLEVNPTLSPEAHKNLAQSYSDDMQAYVMEHCTLITDDMFDAVEENAQQGYRFDRLANIIKSRYDVSKGKAQFLARQQSALYMSKFQQERYEEAGIRTYRWSTSRDERVRTDHKKLNGHIFSWDSPPIVDSTTGRRANPGEDFNCRCVPIPILKSMKEAA